MLRIVCIINTVAIIGLAAIAHNGAQEPTIHTSNGTLMHMRPSNVPLATYGHNGRIDAAAYCVGNEVMLVTQGGLASYVDGENGLPAKCEDFRRMVQ